MLEIQEMLCLKITHWLVKYNYTNLHWFLWVPVICFERNDLVICVYMHYYTALVFLKMYELMWAEVVRVWCRD